MRVIPATSHPQAPLAAALLFALGLAPAAGIAATCEDTLRSMVGSASSGDTVDLTTFALSCSNVTLTQGEIGVGVDNLTINGPPNGALTLSGNKSGRVFSHSGLGTLTLANLTLQDGWLITTSARGGGVYSKGSIALDHVHVSDCLTVATGPYASAGGAIAAGQRISLTDSIVSGNTAFGDPALGEAIGGGLAAFNYARVNLPSVVAVRSSISGNRANSYGAAGGGIFAEGGIVLDSSTVDDNSSVSPQIASAANHGGGIAVAAGFASPVSFVVNSTISGNSTSGKAGGAYFGAQTQVLNSTIAFNSAASCGGAAVSAPSGMLSVYSSIVWDPLESTCRHASLSIL